MTLTLSRPPSWLPRLAFAPAQTAPRGDTLVVIFLRGAADVLNMVVPHGESAYYALRPSLGIPRPDDSHAQKTTSALSTSTDSSACTRPCTRCLKAGRVDTWPSFMPAVRPTNRAVTSRPWN